MGEVWYYKGVHRVKVLTESEGYWIVEALEEFEDDVDGEKVTVKVGEQRIVPSESVHKREVSGTSSEGACLRVENGEKAEAAGC
jgi:predicted ATP-grasp superfamily ATP-dependent carboligase